MITVHLAGVGSKRFTSFPDADAWIERQSLKRDCEMPVTAPSGVDSNLWAAVRSASGALVFDLVVKADGPISTREIRQQTGLSRPSVSRILQALAKLGRIRDLGQPSRHADKLWERVYP